VAEADSRAVLARLDVPADGRAHPVRRKRLGAPDDGSLVGLLEAKVERSRRDRELDLERPTHLGRDLRAARPEALDPLARLHGLEHRPRRRVDLEAEQHVGHLASYILATGET